jgi:uncharacterized protein YwqG
MKFLDKLFGNNKPQADLGSQISLTPEQFLATDKIQEMLNKFSKRTTVFHPQISDKPLSPSISKFGGLPNLNNFKCYPCCDVCDTPLNFVVQLYKHDFPEHYFPQGKDLFQLFRCPNSDCIGAYSDYSDLKMFVYYFKNDASKISEITLPSSNPLMEVTVPDCYLKPVTSNDYPMFYDFGDELNDVEDIYGEKLLDYFIDQYESIQRTKTGGWPSFTQSSHYPMCECGKKKSFFFQLSSEDPEVGNENSKADHFSPHQIMIGDLGNIYYYVCEECGEATIESYWDCC